MKTIFTDQEAAQIAVEFTRQRVEQIAKSLKDLRDRELLSKTIPGHVNHKGTAASGAIEDKPANLNLSAPKMEETSGTHRSEETSAKVHEVLCKECGKSHDLK